MHKVTIGDVAREAGVSLGTVSNALNHPEKVRPETRKAVQDAIRKLGYSPNQSARVLAGGANRSFGLVLPNLEHGISLQIANGAHAEARAAGYNLLIANADNDDILEDSYLRYFMGTQMSGIMVQPMSVYGWETTIKTPSIPTVYLDLHSDHAGYFVGADNYAQGKLLAEHALERKATHVALIGHNEFEKLGMRIDAIRDVLGHQPDVEFEYLDDGSWNLGRDGVRIGMELARRPVDERPDFVIGLTDVLAAGAISGIMASGLKVPGDIKVAGCDGNPLAWNGNVPLTTIAPPGNEIGRRGVRYLLRQIEDKRRSAHPMPVANHQQIVPSFLIARASTGDADGAIAEDISAYL